MDKDPKETTLSVTKSEGVRYINFFTNVWGDFSSFIKRLVTVPKEINLRNYQKRKDEKTWDYAERADELQNLLSNLVAEQTTTIKVKIRCTGSGTYSVYIEQDLSQDTKQVVKIGYAARQKL